MDLRALTVGLTIAALSGCAGSHETSGDADEGAKASIDMQLAEYHCKVQRAREVATYEDQAKTARVNWVKQSIGLARQFLRTPWAKIPKPMQAKVKAQHDARNEQARVAVSRRDGIPLKEVELSCRPEFPHCMDLTHPSNRDVVGRFYQQEVIDALKRFEKAAARTTGTTVKLEQLEARVLANRDAPPPIAELDRMYADSLALDEQIRKAHEQALKAIAEGSAVPDMKDMPAPVHHDCSAAALR